MVTRNEVLRAEDARDGGACDLALVIASSNWPRGQDEWWAPGGRVRVISPAKIEDATLEPTVYRYRLPDEPTDQ